MFRKLFVLAGTLAAMALMPTLAAAQSTPNASHPCDRAVNCDCETIDAGLLTGPWRDDCRNCQKNIRQKCMEAYTSMPLYLAMTAGGYCENACSVTGDNPRPKAPDAQPEPAANETTPTTPKPLRLQCNLDEEWVHEDKDGMIYSGCVKDGKRHGLWLVQNADGNVTLEILYENGNEVWRKEPKNDE